MVLIFLFTMDEAKKYHFSYANIIIFSSVKNYYLNNKHCESNLVQLLQEVVKENLTPLHLPTRFAGRGITVAKFFMKTYNYHFLAMSFIACFFYFQATHFPDPEEVEKLLKRRNSRLVSDPIPETEANELETNEKKSE